TAVAFTEGRNIKVARFGDNMREVAVTEGDKAEAQIQFGWSVNGYGVGDLVQRVNEISDAEVDRPAADNNERDEIGSNVRENADESECDRVQVRRELSMKAFLKEGNATAFTTNFVDLHGLKQLPGLAVQRLMAEGYGFGAE